MQILVVSSWFPYPPDNGSRIRAYNIVKTLAAKHAVTLLSFVDADFLPEHAETLRKLCQEVVTTPRLPYHPDRARALVAFLSPQPRFVVDTHSPAMQRLVDERLARGSFDLLFASQLSAAIYVRSDKHLPTIFDELELGIFYDGYAKASGAQRWRRALTWHKMARYVRQLVKRFDAITVVSEREKMLAAQSGVAPKWLTVLPNAIDYAAYQGVSALPEPNTLIYTGALTYSANLDAMRYFVSEILPLVRARIPQVQLRITGRADQVAINELSVDNAVLFTGYVEDVRPCIAASSVCIVPLRLGGGTRLKVLEAMALGTPIVSTSKGIEGLDLSVGQSVLVGDTPQEFAAHVIALLNNPALGKRLAEKARVLVQTHYDWQQLGRTLDELVLQVTHTN